MSAGKSNRTEAHEGIRKTDIAPDSTFLMWQSAIQISVTGIYCMFGSPIAGVIGPGKWYILGAGLNMAVFVLSVPFVPETRYARSLTAYGQEAEPDVNTPEKAVDIKPMRMSDRPALDFENYQARTIWSDMRLFVGPPDWSEGLYALRVSSSLSAAHRSKILTAFVQNTFQILFFPNVFWAFCMNGLTLGANIALGTTYGTILSKPPYNFPNSSVSYITVGQPIIMLFALPLLGQGSDWIIKWRARRNNGIHEPEARIIPLFIPIVVGILSAVFYGEAATHPERYHWFAIAFAYAGYTFCFIGANIVGITFLLDAYPARSGPVLIVICALRGFISFGTSYGVSEFITTAGYDGAFGTYAGLTAMFGLIGIPIYIWSVT